MGTNAFIPSVIRDVNLSHISSTVFSLACNKLSQLTHHPTGGGTAFLIREPFTQFSSSTPQFSSFEASSVTLKLPQAKISVFNIYRPPSSSAYSVSDNTFLHYFNEFLSFAVTTPHEFIITGDFNIHLDNPTDPLLLSSCLFSLPSTSLSMSTFQHTTGITLLTLSFHLSLIHI